MLGYNFVKIVFGIMSAVHSAATVKQLVRALAPWPVVIHHDFSQTPDFVIDEPNVIFVPQPKRTGWGAWGFSQGVLHLLDHCLHVEKADYFQLLSPTCLPIRPVADLQAHVLHSPHDVHISYADLSTNRDLLMNFGHRAYLPAGSLRFRALRRLRTIYFGEQAQSLPIANMQTYVRAAGRLPASAWLALALTRLAQRGWFGSHPFQSELRSLIGGTWFGCKRDAGLYLLSKARDERLREFFARIWIPDEMLFASLFGSSPFEVGLSNHIVNRFTEGNPNWFDSADLDTLFATKRFFARKFRDDPTDTARRDVLLRITRAQADCASGSEFVKTTVDFAPVEQSS